MVSLTFISFRISPRLESFSFFGTLGSWRNCLNILSASDSWLICRRIQDLIALQSCWKVLSMGENRCSGDQQGAQVRAHYLLQVGVNLIELPLLGTSLKKGQRISSVDAVDWNVGLLKCSFRKTPDLSTLYKHRVILQMLLLPHTLLSGTMWRPASPLTPVQGVVGLTVCSVARDPNRRPLARRDAAERSILAQSLLLACCAMSHTASGTPSVLLRLDHEIHRGNPQYILGPPSTMPINPALAGLAVAYMNSDASCTKKCTAMPLLLEGPVQLQACAKVAEWASWPCKSLHKATYWRTRANTDAADL